MVQKSAYTDTEAHADECVLASSGAYNEANTVLGLIEYLANIFQGRIEAQSRLFSSYSMRPRKIFALFYDSTKDSASTFFAHPRDL